MTLPVSSSAKHRSPVKPPARIRTFTPYDRYILLGRFSFIVINYLIVYYWWQPLFRRAMCLVPFIVLFYGFSFWIGPRFFKFNTINILLTLFDIILVTLGVYYLPVSSAAALLFINMTGIVINILYGKILLSIILAALATLSFAGAAFYRFSPEHPRDFYYAVISFNLLNLLFCLTGLKIKGTIRQVEHDKEESKKQLHRLETLSRIAKEIAGELEIDKLLFLILQKALQLVGVHTGGIILKDTDHVFRIKTVKGLPKSLLEKEIIPGIGLLGKVLTEQRTIFETNYSDFDQYLSVKERHRFAVAFPIAAKGEFLGVIFLLGDHYCSSFPKDEQLIIETLGEHAAVAVINARLFKQTTTLSMNDYLTGVGNIRYFFQQLEHALAIAERYRQPCSLMIVDSDSLKTINDLYGNTQGFRHIKQLAEILKKFIRNADIIARYDRDMFMIILPQTTIQEAAILGERIQNAVAQSPFIGDDGRIIATTVSIAISAYPNDAKNSQGLVSLVESCLHYAKCLGKNQLITTKEYENL